MFLRLLSLVLGCFLVTHARAQTKLSDVTNILGFDTSGVVGGFASLKTTNQGQKIDIIVINSTGKAIDVLFCQTDDTYVRETVIEIAKDGPFVITGVAAADFDGDGLNDYMLVERKPSSQPTSNPSEPVHVQIYWGQTRSGLVSEYYNVTVVLKDDPLVFDYNADAYPDLLGELHSDGSRVILLGGANRTLTQKSFPPLPAGASWPPFMIPQSSAFVDVNNDMYADLVVTTEIGYEIHYNINGKLEYNSTIPLPEGYNKDVITQIAVADINMDGFIDIIVPACNDSSCSQSCIWVYSHGSWKLMLDGFSSSGLGFATSLSAGNFSFPVSLHISDYNRDGYPDALAFIREKGADSVAVLLDNVACTASFCGEAGRMFVVDAGTILNDVSPAVVGSFVDLYSNGVSDVIVVALTGHQSNDQLYPMIRLYKQSLSADACFLKVEVSTGVCGEGTCTSNVNPYSVNQVGATIQYQTTAVDGYAQVSSSGQLMQSAHFALQSPYALFGLGMTPNYVDAVIVGMAESVNASVGNIQRVAEWAQIIPNSQLLVLPFPLNEPDSWEMKLFVTPSELVMLTGFCLLGLCGFMAIIAGILHWRERREDMEEKRQESHKFHFDAM